MTLAILLAADKNRKSRWIESHKAGVVRDYCADNVRFLSGGLGMTKYLKLRRRVEAVMQDHNERFDIFGDGSVLLTMTDIRQLMESLDGCNRGLPSQRDNRNESDPSATFLASLC